jgi:hypothetical protein
LRAPLVPLELTVGGGGTASAGPNIFPIKLLMNPVGWLGGGGTTARAGSETLPLAKRRMSCETSVEGGGAITDGAGKVSFAFRFVARSGDDTGGGTTATFVICTGVLESSRLTALGAGAITLPLSAGADRTRSRVTLGAGATTLALSEGADRMPSRDTRGAGAITDGASAGATSRCSCETLGAGAITAAFRVGVFKG